MVLLTRYEFIVGKLHINKQSIYFILFYILLWIGYMWSSIYNAGYNTSNVILRLFSWENMLYDLMLNY